jgi:formylglycine-generating enzyme
MKNFELKFSPGISFPMVFVQGTRGTPYLFGVEKKIEINVNDFYISKFPVTQTVWE